MQKNTQFSSRVTTTALDESVLIKFISLFYFSSTMSGRQDAKEKKSSKKPRGQEAKGEEVPSGWKAKHLDFLAKLSPDERADYEKKHGYNNSEITLVFLTNFHCVTVRNL
jgi:hypothetical protein